MICQMQIILFRVNIDYQLEAVGFGNLVDVRDKYVVVLEPVVE